MERERLSVLSPDDNHHGSGSKQSKRLSGDMESSKLSGNYSRSSRTSRSPHPSAPPSVRTLILSAARQTSTPEFNYRDIDNEINLVDPSELTNEEMEEWIATIAQDNKSIEAEVWLFEKFWMRTRQTATPSDLSPRAQGSSKTSFEEYEEMFGGSNNRQEATFKECMMNQQESNAATSAGRKSAASFRSTIGSKAMGAQRLFEMGKASTSSKSTNLTTTSSLDSEASLEVDQKLDIATFQVRKMKEDKVDRKERHEGICRNKNSEIEQHKEHLKSLRKYRLLFTRENNRLNGLSGDAILKFYDDVIKHENHTKDIIRLSNINLKTKGKYVMNNIRMTEEGGNNYKLVDYQKLELMNDERQQVLNERGSVTVNQKNLLSDCNFHLNRWRKRLELVEREGEKLRKEKAMRHSIIAQVENETKAVQAMKRDLQKERSEITALTSNYVTPDITSYVQEVATNESLHNEVRTWERKVHLLRFSLQELKTTLQKLERETRGAPFVSDDDDDDDDGGARAHGSIDRANLAVNANDKFIANFNANSNANFNANSNAAPTKRASKKRAKNSSFGRDAEARSAIFGIGAASPSNENALSLDATAIFAPTENALSLDATAKLTSANASSTESASLPARQKLPPIER